MRKYIIALAALSLYACCLSAQINGSVKLGLTGYQGDLHCRSDESIGLFQELNPSFGLGIHIPLSKVIGFRGELSYFKLTGDETQFESPGHADRGWEFKDNLFEISGLVDWEILGKRRYKNGTFQRTLTPVIFGGVGLGFTNSDVDWKNSNNANIERDRVYDKNAELTIPLGLGLKYYISEKFAIATELAFRMPVSDYYDGVSFSGNPDNDDLFGFGGVKVYFGFGGKKDQDGDGIADRKDACPEIFGSKSMNGCPDTDGDGVGDANDKCPTLFGPATSAGCPDSDGDGVVDFEDACPMVKGAAAMKGCPDSDNDGIIDAQDRCPNVAAAGTQFGCPDTDGDGVTDEYDACPDVAGLVHKQGCPADDTDTDMDGVIDEEDECPEVAGSINARGCPNYDFDGDGVLDKDDKCPSVAGDISNGCPDGIIPPQLASKCCSNEEEEEPEELSCNCYGNENPIFNIPSKSPRSLSKLGTNPEFGNSHSLDARGFYEKLNRAYNSSARDKKFLDNLFKGMGYGSFADATPEMFYETILPYGTRGNIGYSKNHKTLYATLNVKSEKDLMAFRIQSANGCDMHFMKTCGNHFFFCK